MKKLTGKNPAPFTENILDAPGNEPVCYCSNVTKGEILGAISAGAKTLKDIRERTGACILARCEERNPRGR